MPHRLSRPALAVVPAALAILLCGTALPAYGQGLTTRFADLASVDLAVAQFTGRAIGAPGGAVQPVDRRLRLAYCQSPLMVGWHNGANRGSSSSGGAHDTVLVRCPDIGSWRLFVPVVPMPVEAAPAAAPIVVQRGEGVTIAMVGEGFSVEQAGEALDPGPLGAWVRVRTGARADPLRARIVRPGQVEVPVD